MFGSSLTATNGSTVKFDPVKGTDTMMRSGTTQTISTKLMCLTSMKQYENKSLEEIRVEDYQANRKTGGMTSTGFGTTSTGSSIFGSKPATSAFGQTTTTGFGQAGASTSIFGSTPQKPAGSLFGAPQQTSSPFGAANAGTSLFQKPAFGQTTSSSIFGGTSTATTTQSAFGFGSKPSTSTFGTGGFGQPAAGTGTSLFGQQPQNKPLFGSAATQPASGGMFGAPPAGQPAPGASIFGGGATATQGASLFGQPQQTTSLFGQPQQPTTGLFGQPQAAQQPGTSLFGAQTVQQPAGGGIFGTAASAQPSAFGAGAFGPKPGGGLFGAATQPQQVQQVPTSVQPLGQSVLQVQQPAVVLTQDTEQMLRQSIVESQMALYPYGSDNLLKTFSVKSTEDEARKQVKERLEKERLLNSFAASKAAELNASGAADKLKLDEGLKKFNQCVLTASKPTVFNYKPLVRRPNASQAEDSRQLSLLGTSAGSAHNRSSQLETGLFIPAGVTSSCASKRRDNPKFFDTSVLRNRSARLDDSVLSTASKQNDSAKDKSDAWSENKEDISIISQSPPETDQKSKSILESPAKTLNFSAISIQSNDENVLNKTLIQGPCGVTVSSRSIYTEPSFDDLANFVRDGKVFIPEMFKVGRLGYGSIVWEGPLFFSDLDLNEIVKFHRREVVVYPDDAKKPPLGEEFNRPAFITLENIYPIDKITREYITDPQSPELQRFGQILERKCLKMGCSFVEYEAEGGLWSFRVKHFSKYGLYDDEDDDAALLTEQRKLVALQAQHCTTQTSQTQTAEMTEVIEMDDLDDLLSAESRAPGALLQQRVLNFDDTFNHTVVDPKRLFATESPEVVAKKRLRLTEDIVEFQAAPFNFFATDSVKADFPVVRTRKNKVAAFDLTEPIFAELRLDQVMKATHPIRFRRVGFGPSDSLQVTVLSDPKPHSAAVHISHIKLVPTIESYLKQHLTSVNNPDYFETLIRTELLRMNPTSDLIRVIDEYLFKELRLNFSLDEVEKKMLRFAQAVCQDHRDVRFAALQRRALQTWLQTELEPKMEKAISSAPAGSKYAPVFYALIFGAFDRAAGLARQAQLFDLALLIGLYMAGTRVPERLVRFQQQTMEHVKEGGDPYRPKIYALLSHLTEYKKDSKQHSLFKDLPILQCLAAHLRLFSTFKSTVNDSLEPILSQAF